MRLCGISTCFQVLSPGMGQVAHALLTRPPLRHVSLGFNMSPFDLHVLGTPPAFILSQDQTLMLVLRSLPDRPLLAFSVLLRSAVFSASPRLCHTAPHGFASFRFPLLFTVFGSFFSLNILFRNFQGCTAVFLSRFFVPAVMPELRCCSCRNSFRIS